MNAIHCVNSLYCDKLWSVTKQILHTSSIYRSCGVNVGVSPPGD